MSTAIVVSSPKPVNSKIDNSIEIGGRTWTLYERPGHSRSFRMASNGTDLGFADPSRRNDFIMTARALYDR